MPFAIMIEESDGKMMLVYISLPKMLLLDNIYFFVILHLIVFSGPKRYDFVHNTWVYSHEPDQCMHQLLSQEISVIAQTDIDFTNLAHGKTKA